MGRLGRTKEGLITIKFVKMSSFFLLQDLIHLELIDGSYSQVPANVKSEEERKQDRSERDSKLS